MLASSGESGPPCGTPLAGRLEHTTIHDTAAQVEADEMEHPAVGDLSGNPAHQSIVLHPVEEFRQVDVNGPGASFLPNPFRDVPHGIMRAATRPETVAPRTERGIEDRHQHLRQRLLDQAIQHRRDAQRSPAAVRFGKPGQPRSISRQAQ